MKYKNKIYTLLLGAISITTLASCFDSNNSSSITTTTTPTTTTTTTTTTSTDQVDCIERSRVIAADELIYETNFDLEEMIIPKEFENTYDKYYAWGGYDTGEVTINDHLFHVVNVSGQNDGTDISGADGEFSTIRLESEEDGSSLTSSIFNGDITEIEISAKTYGSDYAGLKLSTSLDNLTYSNAEEFILTNSFDTYTYSVDESDIYLKIEALGKRSNLDSLKIYGTAPETPNDPVDPDLPYCDELDGSSTSTDPSTPNTPTTSTETSTSTSTTPPTSISSSTSSTPGTSTSTSTSGPDIPDDPIPTTPNDLKYINDLDPFAPPTTGVLNPLVLFVDFSSSQGTASEIDYAMTGFNGESSETDWESVQSYYYKSSYGKLTLDAKAPVKEWYRSEYNTGYYNNFENEDYYGDGLLLDETISSFDNQIDYSDYDSNGDTLIDMVYLVYHNNYSTEDDSIYWAYVWPTGVGGNIGGDDVYVGKYCFISYQFFNEIPLNSNDPYDYDEERPNAETFIHETGHMLGLDDYYDYDAEEGSKQGGLGSADMMDYNNGDHNLFSKTLLGWTDVKVLSSVGTYDLTLGAFETSDTVYLIKNESDKNTITGEYYLLQYYSHLDLNNSDRNVSADISFDDDGLVIYHLNTGETTISSENPYGSIFENNNSYTYDKLIEFVEQDNGDEIQYGNDIEQEDIFTDLNTSYELSSDLSNFYNHSNVLDFNFTIHDITSSELRMTVNITDTK